MHLCVNQFADQVLNTCKNCFYQDINYLLPLQIHEIRIRCSKLGTGDLNLLWKYAGGTFLISHYIKGLVLSLLLKCVMSSCQDQKSSQLYHRCKQQITYTYVVSLQQSRAGEFLFLGCFLVEGYVGNKKICSANYYFFFLLFWDSFSLIT